jgi:signal transduction histidine kinase
MGQTAPSSGQRDGRVSTAQQREFAETTRTSGDHLLTLINNILDFSKIESGMLELEEAPFDLRLCVEDALQLLAPKAREKAGARLPPRGREPGPAAGRRWPRATSPGQPLEQRGQVQIVQPGEMLDCGGRKRY